MAAPPCTSTGFYNSSPATPEQIAKAWQQAQTNIATQPILLDPLGSHPHTAPADPRAFNVESDGSVSVIGMANALTPNNPGFPTSDSPTGYAGGLTKGGSSGPWTVEVVTPTPTTIDAPAMEWEFENVILYKLGYSLEGR